MPGVDWIPGISQLKAGLQLVTGDVDGAAQTMENFAKECPGISQVTSLVQVAVGDTDGAIETQKRCLGTVNNVANGIPLVGHAKGAVHHMLGDHEGGNQALNAATRSTVVIASGAAAGLATGGIGAIPAGIAAGGAYDITATVVTDKPQGYVAAVQNAVENPSAGAFFDAAMIPVGDGLAGYSGGELANKVATQIKLSKLEAARAAKTDQVNAILFDEVPAGAEGGAAVPNSADLTSLGKEINTLTSQIHNLKHGTPQYWFDAKTGEIVVEVQGNNAAVPVIGYIEEKDVEKRKVIFRELCAVQENGFAADMYIKEEKGLSKDERRACVQKSKQQSPGNKKLKDAYPNVPVLTRDQINNLKLESKDPKGQLRAALGGCSWLHVRMPAEFNYTGAIMVNSESQGLLHSFIRHWDQWQEYIPRMKGEIQKQLSELLQKLNKVKNAPTEQKAKEAAKELMDELKKLKDDDFIRIQKALNDFEMDLHKFIQDNVTYQNYLGEGGNPSGLVQVYFKVKDLNGNVRVMAVCVSKQLYPEDGSFPDSRPVRTITTVFFMTWQEYLNKVLCKLF